MKKKWIALGAAGGATLFSVLPVLQRRAMRITTILKKDHRVVSGMFLTLETLGRASTVARNTLFQTIKTELESHAKAEEEVFYTAVARVGSGEAQEVTGHSRDEHQEIIDLLAEIDMMGPNAAQFMAKVAELKQTVQHHVQEEETKVHTLATEHMYTEELEELGRRFTARKKELRKMAKAA
jgi:hypothetical protein